MAGRCCETCGEYSPTHTNPEMRVACSPYLAGWCVLKKKGVINHAVCDSYWVHPAVMPTHRQEILNTSDREFL